MHHDHIHDHDHEYHGGLRSTQNVVGNTTNQDGFHVHSGNRCTADKPSSAWIEESSRIVSQWRSKNKLGLNDEATINVDMYFHVISAYDDDNNNNEDNDNDDSSVSDEQLQNQMDLLNESYRPYGFSFTLKGTTRTNNPEWYTAIPSSLVAGEMKRTLRVGGAATLNVYLNSSPALGYATLPNTYRIFPALDGVVIRDQSIPGGDLLRYNEGKTLVHEVGHWLGLLHTFPDVTYGFGFTCPRDGDRVDDTPRQKTASFGCQVGKDSCPFFPGVDNIHNYMDYSDDACMIEFSAGQAERMHAMWNEYRASG